MAKAVRESQTQRGVRSVDHALAILNQFESSTATLGLTELSDRLGLSKGAVHALLVSLARAGFVDRAGAGARYQLGPRLVHLAGLRLQQSVIRGSARPILERLVHVTGETAFLGVVEGDRALYADRVESQHRLRVVGEVGTPIPLHATALGKILLAHLPPQQIRAILTAPLEAYTRHTITDPGRLATEIEAIRACGFAVSMGERDEFTAGVATPVRGFAGMVTTAITVAGVIGRLDIDASIHALREAARELSAILGAPGGENQ
ncbi:MAG: IclR family transcriptional regulator [Chloroflexi bacterium]|nr:IclR family transcriptional regulator [Chloroflexota bacterium]